MAIYVTSFDVAGSVEKIFPFLADFSNAASWDPGVPRAVKLDEGALGLGSSFDVDATFLGSTTTLTYEIVRFSSPYIVEFRAETRWMTSHDEISLLPLSDGVHVTYIAKLSLRKFLFAADPALQVAFDLIGDRARDGLQNALRELSAAPGRAAESRRR